MSERVISEVPLEAVKKAGYVAVEAEGQEILIVATRDGVRVYSGICPHLGGPLLKAEVRDDRVRCPWHRYEFDAIDGRCLSPPGRVWRNVPGRTTDRPFDLRLIPLAFQVHDGRIRIFSRGG